ncbi:uncharacterized protein METZ01_LOCUS115766 [marine metagenome]|uniref:Guanylate cyclase domain-containing protein n=1 Tax=marine metagenome TaxID=408172 RepID=A0A381XEF2_9ZZZZ
MNQAASDMNTKQHSGKPLLSDDCLVCGTGLTGIGGFVLGLAGVKRAIKNPNVCNRCNMHIEDGQIVEVSILFIDLCSFTAMTHDLGPEKTHTVVDSFLSSATQAVLDQDGVVDKYIGDAVMALFNVPIQRPDHTARTITAAKDIIALMPRLSETHGTNLQCRAGVATGAVRVGRLGSADVNDFTALGDAVNRAARLQAQARPGEVVVDVGAYQKVANTFHNSPAESMDLKGFPSPVLGHRLAVTPDVEPGSFSDEVDGSRLGKTRRLPSFGAFLVALLGAPCLLGAALSPVPLVLAISSVVGSSAPVLISSPYLIDHWMVRLPLMLLALIAVGINLFMVFNARRVRKSLQAAGQHIELTARERKRETWVLALSFLTIAMVALENLAHHFVMHHRFF